MPSQDMIYRIMATDAGAAAAFTGLSQKARLAATATQDLTAASLRAADAEKFAADAAVRAADLRIQASKALQVAKDREIAGDKEGAVAAREAADGLKLQASAAAATSRELNASAVAAGRQAAAIETARAETGLHATSLRGLIGETSGLTSAMERVPTPVTVVAGAVGKLAVGVGGLAAVVGAYSLDQAVKFQSAMAHLHTQAGVSNKGVAAFSAGVLKMAGVVASSPTTLADAAYHIASVGKNSLSTAQQLRVLKMAAEGAKVGNADLTDETNALDAAVVSHIKGVKNYSQAMGILNATVGAGDMTTQNLADALGTNLLPAAKEAGLSLKDVGAALAVLGDGNQRGATAATRFTHAIQLMQTPSNAAAAALKTIGISSDRLGNDLRSGGLPKALGDLKAHLKDSGLTATQQAQVISKAFGGSRTAGSIDLLLQQLDRLKGKEGDVGKGGAGFASSWHGYTKTFGYDLDSAKAGVEALAISLGTKLLPDATKAMHWIATKGVADLDKLGKWFEAHKTQIEEWGKVALGVFKLLTAAFTGTFHIFAAVVDVFEGKWGAAWGNLKAIANGYLSALKDIFGHFTHEAGTFLLHAGENIIGGLVSGIESKFGDVKNSLGSLTHKIIGWKGPPEFDKVMLTPAGEAIINGLVKGMKSKEAAVKAISHQLSHGLIDGWTGESAKIKDAFSTPIQDAMSQLTSELEKNASRQQDVLKKMEASYRSLGAARKSAIGALKASIVGSTDISNVLGLTKDVTSTSTDFSGDSSATSTNTNTVNYTGNIGQSLKKSAGLARTEAKDLAILRHMHLSQALIEQIGAESPADAITLAQQIISGQAGSISSLNHSESVIQKAARSSARTVVESPHEKAQLAAAKENVKLARDFLEQIRHLNRTTERIAAKDVAGHTTFVLHGKSFDMTNVHDMRRLVAELKKLGFTASVG